MNRVRAFFLEEATAALDTLRLELSAAEPTASRAHTAARLLRGSAQMARYGAISREAGALERALREVARSGGPVPPPVVDAARRRLHVLEEGVEAVRTGGMEADPRMETVMAEQQEHGAGEVPLEELEYRGRRALERALELRSALEDAIVNEESVGLLMDEIFDLIRLGME